VRFVRFLINGSQSIHAEYEFGRSVRAKLVLDCYTAAAPQTYTSAGWQVTLRDPMWHVSSRSGVATLRTAIHLLRTYLLSLVRYRRVVLSDVKGGIRNISRNRRQLAVCESFCTALLTSADR